MVPCSSLTTKRQILGRARPSGLYGGPISSLVLPSQRGLQLIGVPAQVDIAKLTGAARVHAASSCLSSPGSLRVWPPLATGFK